MLRSSSPVPQMPDRFDAVVFVVTGGASELGRGVIDVLAAAGHAARPASRRTGVDLETGARVRTVVSDADVIVHCASDPARARRVDLEGTRRMVEILHDLGRRPHVVYISIVGVDRIRFPLYRAKYATEIALTRSGLPVTVLRATQFHPLVATLARRFSLGPTALAPRGMRFDSIEIQAVAERLAELALGPVPAGFVRTNDLAGPSPIDLADAIEQVALHDGRKVSRVLTLPPVSPFLLDYAAGRNLVDADADRVGRDFSSWLADQPVV